MGTNCASLVVDSVLFCHGRDFVLSLSVAIFKLFMDSFNSTSRYIDDLINIENSLL